MAEALIILIIILKFAIPLFMVSFPFLAIWTNYFLDIIDGDILQFLGMIDFNYQTIDKAADYFSYIFMVAAGWRWHIRNTLIVLFIYRSIGQFLFFFTRDELMFFYFQNFLEPLLLIYTLIILKQRSEAKAFVVYKKHKLVIWTIVIGYKLWNEWYLHFANIDLSTLFLGING